MFAYGIFAVILSIPILLATAIGGTIGRIAGSRRVACWTSALLGAVFYAGGSLWFLYYNEHLAGGVPPPAPPLGAIVANLAVGGSIFGVLSFVLCRVMR